MTTIQWPDRGLFVKRVRDADYTVPGTLEKIAKALDQNIDGTCDYSGNTSPIEETVTAGASSLTYNPLTDQYEYIWKTEKSWKGQCRQLVVTLKDGTTHTANFQFK